MTVGLVRLAASALSPNIPVQPNQSLCGRQVTCEPSQVSPSEGEKYVVGFSLLLSGVENHLGLVGARPRRRLTAPFRTVGTFTVECKVQRLAPFVNAYDP